MVILPDWVKDGFVKIIQPIIDIFIKAQINPNTFTTIGFIVSLFAAYFFGAGSLRAGGALLLFAGIFDIFDGRIARATGQVTKFGALYDSTLDRYSEVIVFFGIAYYFIVSNHMLASVAAFIALGGSIMVSYVRARAEGLGFSCKVGIMQRPERIVTLGITSLIHLYVFIAGIVFVAIFANITAIQRIYYVWAQENGKKDEKINNLDQID
ncbi:MAG: CDP-alcohol phosphatidyltransferase family protein [Calditrichaeota bacterium]|nr:CDP-alcohol phosphatidyltransferase family protein [Calditrichota bacterium]